MSSTHPFDGFTLRKWPFEILDCIWRTKWQIIRSHLGPVCKHWEIFDHQFDVIIVVAKLSAQATHYQGLVDLVDFRRAWRHVVCDRGCCCCRCSSATGDYRLCASGLYYTCLHLLYITDCGRILIFLIDVVQWLLTVATTTTTTTAFNITCTSTVDFGLYSIRIWWMISAYCRYCRKGLCWHFVMLLWHRVDLMARLMRSLVLQIGRVDFVNDALLVWLMTCRHLWTCGCLIGNLRDTRLGFDVWLVQCNRSLGTIGLLLLLFDKLECGWRRHFLFEFANHWRRCRWPTWCIRIGLRCKFLWRTRSDGCYGLGIESQIK